MGKNVIKLFLLLLLTISLLLVSCAKVESIAGKAFATATQITKRMPLAATPQEAATPAAKQRFPSTLVAINRAGSYNWAKPTDPEILALIPDEYKGKDENGADKEIEWVKKWQIDHGDICIACEDFTSEANKKTIVIDYNYYQMMRANPRFEEGEMRKKLIIDGKANDWEGLFLHFNVDTFVEVNKICEDKTPWTGRLVLGYLNSKNGPYGDGLSLDKPNWNLDVFANDGVLYVGMPEKFDEIVVDVGGIASESETGSLIFEYAAGIDPASMTSSDRFSENSRWVINKWNKLEVSDGTANFAKDGSVTFKPPGDWVLGTPYPAYFPGRSPEIGSELYYGIGYYMIRIKVNTPFKNPSILNRITTPAWITLKDIEGKKAVKIPGWDPKNDINKDGYIDSNEMGLPTYNSKASARFIHEGRVAQVCTLGEDMYSDWGRYAPNLWNQDYINLKAEFTAKLNKEREYTGNFNDNAPMLLWGSFSYEPLSKETDFGPAILSGGATIEGKALGYGDGGVRNPSMAYEYTKAFINLWSEIKKKTGSKWIGINAFQPYRYPLMKPFVESDTFDFMINEETNRAVLPYIERGSELYGFSKLWFVPAMNKDGKKYVMMGYMRPDDGLLNTEEGWKRRKEALLAVYYLWNIPGRTVFVANAATYEEGGNTGTKMYYKAGVPYDLAMQPTGMLEVDIGAPDSAPKGYSHVPYLACAPFDEPYKYCNTLVGYSGDKSLTLAGYGVIETLPTNQYFLYAKYEGEDGVAAYLKGGAPFETPLPADMVIARSYTKGMVLYRTSYKALAYKDFENNENFAHYVNSNKITVDLPGVYQRVLPDGTLAKPSKTIELRGYEGAILKKPPIRKLYS